MLAVMSVCMCVFAGMSVCVLASIRRVCVCVCVCVGTYECVCILVGMSVSVSPFMNVCVCWQV